MINKKGETRPLVDLTGKFYLLDELDENFVKECVDAVSYTHLATIELGGQNYVFWGGREGYMSLLNTDQKREKEHLAKMLTIARRCV